MSAARSVSGRARDVIDRFAGGGRRRIARSAGVVLESGSGSYLHGRCGGRYLDVVSGYGVASLGHSHPHWVEAVIAQAGKLAVSPFDTIALARYLSALASVLPAQLGRIALFSGGAEAVEAAIRLAQTATGRDGVVTFASGFHGKTTGVRYVGDPTSSEALALAPSWLRTAPYPVCEQHDAVSYAECTESVARCLQQLDARDDLDRVGAVVVEPILGTAGNIPPPQGFLGELRQLCDQRDWLLVLDESITGFGRTGSMFAFERFDVAADILILGKGLGGGFPLSAVCAAPKLWDDSAFVVPSATSSSYGGNPLGCAAGLATLEIIGERGFLEEVREVADRASRRLADLAEASPHVARPRGVGLMLGFDLVETDSGALAGPQRCAAVFEGCRERDLLIAADVPRVRISPPLTITPSEIDHLFDTLHEVLA